MIPLPIHQFFTYGTFALSLFTNSIFIWISTTTITDAIGSYRYLMMGFVAMDVLVSLTHLILMPGIQLTSVGYIFSGYHLVNKPPYMGTWAGICFVVFFYQTFIILAFHYIYRYAVVCEPRWRQIFTKHPIFRWSCVSTFVQLLYTFGYFECVQKPRSSDDSQGEVWQMDAIVGILIAISLFVLTAIVIIICSIRILLKLRISESSLISAQMRKTQHSLLKALVVQTVIPSIFSYFPLAMIFLVPFLGFNMTGVYGDLMIMSTAIFPALDPIIMLYFVRSYRSRIVFLWKSLRTPGMTPIEYLNSASVATEGDSRRTQ